MKYDFVQNLDGFLGNSMKSFYELCMWMQEQFDDIIELIEGSSDCETDDPLMMNENSHKKTDIGEVTPAQKIAEFLSDQNLFNPSEFGHGGILSMTPAEVLTNHYLDCKAFASEHNLSIDDAIVGFSQKQLTFMPNACTKIMRFIMKFNLDN
jgi:hypothetical protein